MKSIHDMNELEMQELLNEISGVIVRNQWTHLIHDAFGIHDPDLEESQLQRLRGMMRDAEMNADETSEFARDAVSALDRFIKQKTKK